MRLVRHAGVFAVDRNPVRDLEQWRLYRQITGKFRGDRFIQQGAPGWRTIARNAVSLVDARDFQ